MEKAKLQLQLTMPCSHFLFISIFIISFSFQRCLWVNAGTRTVNTTAVPVGVILDLSSEMGKGCQASILMASEDFYTVNSKFSTRVNFTFWDSGEDSVYTTSIAENLTGLTWVPAGGSYNGSYGAPKGKLYGGAWKDKPYGAVLKDEPTCSCPKGKPYARSQSYTRPQPYVGGESPVPVKSERKVQAIMGPQTSWEAVDVAWTCNLTEVPLISFSTISPSPTLDNYPLLTLATLDYSSESGPIADLIKYFDWRTIYPVYEDSEYGSSIYQSLITKYNKGYRPDVSVYAGTVIPVNASDSDIEDKLKEMMGLRARLFLVHVVSPRAVRIFQLADKLGMISKGYIWIVTSSVGDILDTLDPAILSSMNGVVGLRTTVRPNRKRVLNFSAEYKARLLNEYNVKVENPTMYQLWAYDAAWVIAMAVEKEKLSLRSGWEGDLTSAINSTHFEGLAGKFSIVDGQRQFSAYEIVNVVDKGVRIIGSWTKDGITVSNKGSSKLEARWPGGLTKPPKSSTYSTTALKIGNPVNRPFKDFVNGLSKRIFKTAVDLLPYQLNCTFVDVHSTSNRYEDLMNDAKEQLDGIVGDIIISEDDAEGSFTSPYMDGGVSMIVRIEQDTSSTNMWMFLRPFPLKLWLVSIVFFVFTGLAIWVTEHRVNPNFGAEDSVIKQLGTTFYFAFSTVVYAHEGTLKSNLSRILLIVWLLAVFVLTASYQASLSAILTVEKLKPAVNSVDELRQSGRYIGCQSGSIVYDFLQNSLGFDYTKIRSFQTADEYADALKKGSANGGVSAIFDVMPYLSVFLNQSQNCKNYTTVGPTYMSKGFGFAFNASDHSDLLKELSGAISSRDVKDLTKNFTRSFTGCDDESTDKKSHAVSFKSFSGLFIITGVVSGLMVIISLIRYAQKNKNHLKSILWENNITVRDRICGLWKNYSSSESFDSNINRERNCDCTKQGPRTDPPKIASPVQMQEIKKGT